MRLRPCATRRFGEGDDRLVIPPAWQLATPFGADIGPVNPAFFSFEPNCPYDSWLTLGVDGPALQPNALTSVGIDFSSWSENRGISSDNGAVFFLDPAHGAQGTTTLMQLTVAPAASFSGSFNLQGRRGCPDQSCGDSVGDWEIRRVEFRCAGGTGCSVTQPVAVAGCTQPICGRRECYNYNPAANVDDGSCGKGCTDHEAYNFNPAAQLSDPRMCQYRNGCTDQAAANYDPEASRDDFSCQYVDGCTAVNADNFDPEATRNDGSCSFASWFSSCTGVPFWQQEELPSIHQLNIEMPRSDFDALVQASRNRAFGPKVGQLTFNNASYAHVELLVHGGNPQRGATARSKPSFRLSFSSDDKFRDKVRALSPRVQLIVSCA
jgi:hypothetical protein